MWSFIDYMRILNLQTDKRKFKNRLYNFLNKLKKKLKFTLC